MTWITPKPGEWKSEELSQGRIIDYKAFNFVDGEGVRNSLYVAGCMFHCEGCYNVATWSFNAGIPYTKELEVSGIALFGTTPYFFTWLLNISHWPPSPIGSVSRKDTRRPFRGSSRVSRMFSRNQLDFSILSQNSG